MQHVDYLEDLVGLEVVHLFKGLDVVSNVRQPTDGHGDVRDQAPVVRRLDRLCQVGGCLSVHHHPRRRSFVAMVATGVGDRVCSVGGSVLRHSRCQVGYCHLALRLLHLLGPDVPDELDKLAELLSSGLHGFLQVLTGLQRFFKLFFENINLLLAEVMEVP